MIDVPAQPNEISLDKGLQINYILHSDNIDYGMKRQILFILTDLNIWDDIENISIDNVLEQIPFIYDQTQNYEYFNTFKLDKKLYGVHNFNPLTLKEYMDIEFYLTYSDNPLEKIDEISAILFRPVKNKTNKLKNILYNKINKLMPRTLIPYSFKTYDIEVYTDVHPERTELFRHKFTYSQGLGAFFKYAEYKNQLMKDFPILFKIESDQIDEYADDQAKFDAENDSIFEENWGLYHVLHEMVPQLSEQELWKTKNVREFFTYLSYMKVKNIHNNKMNNKNG